MCHTQAHVCAFAIFESKHFIAECVPATRFLRNFGRMKSGQIKLLTTNAVHFLAQDLHHFQSDALAQCQIRVDSSGKLPDNAGAEQ